MTARGFERLLIGGIALHSCLLGLAMLFAPYRTLGLVGWDYTGPPFFPSQSGIFLLILGGAYAAALWHRPFAWFLVASKAAAVLFLLTSVLLATGPPIILLQTFADGAMGLAVAAAVVWNDRAAGSGQ